MYSIKKYIPHQVRKNVTKNIRLIRFQLRYTTARFRSLPHFIIIGAQKSGTSSLFFYLSQHPQILKSFRKEPHFFDRNYQRGMNWYRAHFPLEREVSAGSITGEATPEYLFLPFVPEQIYQHIPGVKLIVLLRNPTERAISNYFMEVRAGREHLPIMQAFRQEETRLENVLRRKDFTNPALVYFSYKKRGIYKEQLERFMRFFSENQLLVLNSEFFLDDPRRILRKVFQFLNVDENFEIRDIRLQNVGAKKKEVGPEVYDYLNEYFSPHNRDLYKLLGTDYNWS